MDYFHVLTLTCSKEQETQVMSPSLHYFLVHRVHTTVAKKQAVS